MIWLSAGTWSTVLYLEIETCRMGEGREEAMIAVDGLGEPEAVMQADLGCHPTSTFLL